MAQTAIFWLKRTGIGALALLGAFALGFPLAGWAGSSIPANGAWQQPETGIEIMVETNGTHTGIVVPLANHLKDWRASFPHMAAPRRDGRAPTHIAIGWGEREVFLNVPEWSDLKPGTALRIATVGGEPVMRVAPYVHPAPSAYHRPLRISEEQYRTLVSAIERALPPIAPGEARQALTGTDTDAAYYHATGTYSLVTTCNSWVGNMLAEAGIAMGSWTPFAGGVMKWIPEPAE